LDVFDFAMQLSVGLCAHLLLNWLAAAICLEDKNKECAQWAANGECEKNVNFMTVRCALSCAKKGSGERRSVPLPDKLPLCTQWAADGECEKNPVFMKLECASSCTTQGAPPQDKSDKCKKWAELGECTRNADFMSVECATSCKDRFSLPDKNAMCEQWVATGECLRNTAFMELECAASCHNHTLSERGRADNRTEDCIYWAARGECEKNADFMRSEKGDCLPFCEAAAKAAAEREAAAKEAGKEMARAAAARTAERAQMAERKWQGADGTQVAGRTRKEVGGIDVGSVSGKGSTREDPMTPAAGPSAGFEARTATGNGHGGDLDRSPGSASAAGAVAWQRWRPRIELSRGRMALLVGAYFVFLVLAVLAFRHRCCGSSSAGGAPQPGSGGRKTRKGKHHASDIDTDCESPMSRDRRAQVGKSPGTYGGCNGGLTSSTRLKRVVE